MKKLIWKKIKQNRCLAENLLIKAKVLAAARKFFDQEGFLEVDTPTLVPSPDPSPFNEVLEIKSSNEERLFLTPSPEFFLKKLLAAGFKNIYQITKAYRDQQEKDLLHLREFTILEWYRAGANYTDLMKDCENLVNFIWERLNSTKDARLRQGYGGQAKRPPANDLQWRAGKTQNDNSKFKTLNYSGVEINLSAPWQRISCKEAFEKYSGVKLDEFLDIKKAREVSRNKGYQTTSENTWEELYHQIFLNEVEPRFPKEQPLILYDYPAPLAALAKIKDNDPSFAERFEFYIGGLELGNGYSELTDAAQQKKRLKNDIKTRKAKKMKVFDYDHDFVEALKEGLPMTAGMAVGMDRLTMLFTNSSDIHQVSPFLI